MPEDTSGERCVRSRLLLALPEAELDRLLAAGSGIDLKQGEVVFESGTAVGRVMLPHTAVVSLLVVTGNGAGVDVATVGCEGIIGAGAPGANGRLHARHVALIGGQALAFDADTWRYVLNSCPSLPPLVSGYQDAFVRHLMQSVACNALHSAEQRFARWLLSTADRSHSDEIALTHEYLSQMLAVRRPTITLIAQAFQSSGLITSQRGRLLIADREKLGAVSCECYGIIRGLYERLYARGPS